MMRFGFVVLGVAAWDAPPLLRPIFVKPEWLAERKGDYQVVHSAWGPQKNKIVAVPGAIYLNTDELEVDFVNESSQGVVAEAAKGMKGELPQNFWRLYPDRYLLPALAFLGVDVDSKVVVYGEDVLAGARVAWAMLKAGVHDVRVLDGGVMAWEAAGFPVSNVTNARQPLSKGFGAAASLRAFLVADSVQVRKFALHNGSVGDARTRCEFDGECLPYAYIPTSGRVAGAVFAKGGDSDPYHMESYTFPDGRLRPFSEITALWKELGVCPDATRACVFYCGTGWRSGLATLVALELGFSKAANFDGGWYVYSLGSDAFLNPTIPPREVHA